MMVLDLKPFSIVNDPGFLNFSKILYTRFTVGSDIYYRRLLDKSYSNGVTKVQNKLTTDDTASVSIQLDGWSAHKHGYMGLLVNYITKDCRRAKLCLTCAPFDISHIGENAKILSWSSDHYDNRNYFNYFNWLANTNANASL